MQQASGAQKGQGSISLKSSKLRALSHFSPPRSDPARLVGAVGRYFVPFKKQTRETSVLSALRALFMRKTKCPRRAGFGSSPGQFPHRQRTPSTRLAPLPRSPLPCSAASYWLHRKSDAGIAIGAACISSDRRRLAAMTGHRRWHTVDMLGLLPAAALPCSAVLQLHRLLSFVAVASHVGAQHCYALKGTPPVSHSYMSCPLRSDARADGSVSNALGFFASSLSLHICVLTRLGDVMYSRD